MRIKMVQQIKELIMIWVSSILKASLLNSPTPEAKLIQVTSTAIKHANKSFSLGLEDSFITPLFGLKDGFFHHIARLLKMEFSKTNLSSYDNNFPFHELNFFSKFSSIIFQAALLILL
jgi:hypothetical protein